jgi:hypothetical protein
MTYRHEFDSYATELLYRPQNLFSNVYFVFFLMLPMSVYSSLLSPAINFRHVFFNFPSRPTIGIANQCPWAPWKI